MLRKILCNYEFTYQGKNYKDYGLYLGDTGQKHLAGKDFSGQIVCSALKMTEEELANELRCKYWDISRSKLEAQGFKFLHEELYLYPKP